jgi:HEAT repeat protein
MLCPITSWLAVLVMVAVQGAAAEPPAVDQKNLQEWVQALSARDREVSIKADRRWADALGDANPTTRKRAVVMISAGLWHFSPEVRQRAAEVLARIGPEVRGVVPALVNMLSDPDKKVRTSASNVLGVFGPAAEAAIPALVQLLGGGDDLDAPVSLGQIGPAAIPPLVNFLKNGEKGQRSGAACALGVMGPKAMPALPALIEALRQNDATVQFAILEALCEIRPDGTMAVPAIIPVLKARDVGLRALAAWALSRIGPTAKDAIPDLISALSDNSAGNSASQALTQISPAAIPALTAVLKGDNDCARSLAAAAIKGIHSKATKKTEAESIPTALPRQP